MLEKILNPFLFPFFNFNNCLKNSSVPFLVSLSNIPTYSLLYMFVKCSFFPQNVDWQFRKVVDINTRGFIFVTCFYFVSILLHIFKNKFVIIFSTQIFTKFFHQIGCIQVLIFAIWFGKWSTRIFRMKNSFE